MSGSAGSFMAEPPLTGVSADSGCFICGVENPIGFKASIRVDEQQASSWMKVHLAAEFQGWKDVVHGGILAALLDEACIYACRSRVEQCVTAELQVRYRKPVPVGSEVEVFGQLVETRKKYLSASAQIKIDDIVYAEAKAKIFVLG